MITAEILAGWSKAQAAKEKQREHKAGRVPMHKKKIMLNIKAAAFAASLDAYWSWYADGTKVNKADVIRSAAELIEIACNIHSQARTSYIDAFLLFRHGYDKDARKLRNQTKAIDRVLYEIQIEESTMVRIGKLMAVLEVIGVTVDELDKFIHGKGRRLYANTKAGVS